MKALGKRSLSAILAVIINITWWIEWISGAVIIAAIIIALFSKDQVSLTVPLTFSSINIKSVGSKNSTSNGQLEVMNGNFAFPIEVNLKNTLLLITGVVIVFSVLILITYQLKVIFLNLKKNQPFNKLNIPRIRNVGALLICLFLLQVLFKIALNLFLNAQFKWGEGVKLTYHFEVSFLAAGIVLIIVAEIFRMGFMIEEDNSLNI